MSADASTDYALLIADDDVVFRQTVCEIVQPHFRLYEVSSGEEAVQLAATRKIHLALCDMHMVELTGLETVQRIRQIHRATPCILMSADYTEDLCQQAAAAHAFHVLRKPFSKRELLGTMVRAIEQFYHDFASGPRLLCPR